MMIIFYHNKFCGVSYDNLSYFLVNEKKLLYFFVLLMICVKFLCHRFFFFGNSSIADFLVEYSLYKE